MLKVAEAQNFSASLRKQEKAPTEGQTDALKVDPNFVEDPVVSKIVAYCLQNGKNLALAGPSGCGKSSLVVNVAARLNMPLEVFSCDGETTTDNLIGKAWKKGNDLIPVYGAAVKAYREGKPLLIEEMDRAQPDILTSLHRILEDNQDFITVHVGERETFRRGKGFCSIATTNTIGTCEDAFLVPSAKALDVALKSRFNWWVKMGFLDPDKERNVIMKKTGIQSKIAFQMVEVAKESRRAKDAGETAYPVSTRDLISWL